MVGMYKSQWCRAQRHKEHGKGKYERATLITANYFTNVYLETVEAHMSLTLAIESIKFIWLKYDIDI